MSREVEAYNTYFGDCIILKDKDDDSNLLIVFGTHCLSNFFGAYQKRDELEKKIAEDIYARYKSQNISLLITHFHDDHISGLMYMYNNEKKFKNFFKNIYIANIWNNKFAVASNLLEELLLEKELKSCKLPRSIVTLFDLLDFISVNIVGVRLLSKGVTFEDNKYITLWPIAEDCEKNFLSIIQNLKLSTEFKDKLIELSETICNYVTQEIAIGQDDRDIVEKTLSCKQKIENMRMEYRVLENRLLENKEDLVNSQLAEEQKMKLNKLNHKYNIVFQNCVDGNENILFTGDIEKSQMSKIEGAGDIKLHKKYKYIKIPHHGTESHYFDFGKYNPEYVIITNGKVNINYSEAYRICKAYGNLDATFLCTNSNNCCNCEGSCRYATSKCSTRRKLVFNRLFRRI